MALEAVNRIDEIFDVERDVSRKSADDRLRVRREISALRVAALEAWLRAERAKLSRHAAIAEAIDYMLPMGGIHALSRRRTGLSHQ
jgi:transposase